jgi:hypothetical protein
MYTPLYHSEKFQLTKYSLFDHIFFSCVITIFPEFIWLTTWKKSDHAHIWFTILSSFLSFCYHHLAFVVDMLILEALI